MTENITALHVSQSWYSCNTVASSGKDGAMQTPGCSAVENFQRPVLGCSVALAPRIYFEYHIIIKICRKFYFKLTTAMSKFFSAWGMMLPTTHMLEDSTHAQR